VTMGDERVPNKYTPEPRKFEDKEWLYKQYWGRVKTISDLAEQTDVSAQTIVRSMDALGVPRRPNSCGGVQTPHEVSMAYSRGDTSNSVDASMDTTTCALTTDGGRDVSWADVS